MNSRRKLMARRMDLPSATAESNIREVSEAAYDRDGSALPNLVHDPLWQTAPRVNDPLEGDARVEAPVLPSFGCE
eukprot:CAMPEP_0195592378 /NCGR_PEP_ID=MMETSP0815-20121206/319_1 /TAXON_ID=97485 /ORGANISM="Prymnesium parvum, Strain Texoma1" /LENGTH=74 /DNA_ID=CAMNT_0040731447 /DNA_START=218 /DNA_END=442 /DNA_ORIENTATION=+